MKADFTLQTSSRNSPVYVRDTLSATALKQIIAPLKPDKIFLILDKQVDRHHGELIRETLGREVADVRVCIVPAGEGGKSYEQWKRLTDFLLDNNARRNSLVAAAGGGVTGDLAGFATSTTLRGLPLLHIPTTLLAMVDSSIGGKTGINHERGKNLIGSFYQPEAVFINTGFLASLPRKEWMNGMSEVLKYAAIKDSTLFDTCEKLFLKDTAGHGNRKLLELIRKCAKIKADIVALDEKESDLRMILNFGHTFAHALENLGGYSAVSHGEAVYAGMIAAVHLSNAQSASLDIERLAKFRKLYNINPVVFSYSVDELVESMHSDKKRSSEKLKVVLLQEWNQPYVIELRDTAPAAEAWRFAFDLLR